MLGDVESRFAGMGMEPPVKPIRPASTAQPLITHWSEAVGMVLAVVVAGGLFALVNTVADYLPTIFAIGGLAYGIVGMTVIGIRWVTVPRRADLTAPDSVQKVHAFETGPQRFTLTLNLLLLTVFAVGAAETLFTGSLSLSWLLGGILQVGALVLIASNIPWAYSSRFIVGEQEAMSYRVGSYRLIVANRVLSYSVWAVGTTFAGWLLYNGITGAAGPGF